MSIRVAPQAYKTRAHIYIICTPPQNIFKLFSSQFCVLSPSFPPNIFQIILSRFFVLSPPTLCPATQRKRLHLPRTVNFSLLTKETLYFLSHFFCFV